MQSEALLLNTCILLLEVGGGCIAASALLPLSKMIGIVRAPALKAAWRMMTIIVACCLALLLWSAVSKFGMPAHTSDLAEAGIHVLGPSFVWAVAHLSLRTAKDILRIGALEDAARSDFLTGLANRRSMSERLDEEMGLARPGGGPLSVITLDIDDFKGVNDAHGHAVGDRVLQEVAKLLATNTRSTDMVCRIGGEEFAVIVPTLEASAVAAMAERLRSVIAQARIPVSDGMPIGITISLGVASLKSGEHVTQLMGRADAALYEAKRSGRNRLREAA